MSVKETKHRLSLLLSLMILFGLVFMPPVLAAESAPAALSLQFSYPDDVPADAVLLNVFKGIPMWYQKYGAKEIEDIPKALTDATDYPNLTELLPAKDGSYSIDEAGGYCYFVRGREPGKFYNILKLFIITADDLKAGSKTLQLHTAPSAGTGYETGFNHPVGENGEQVPEGFDQGIQHLVPIEGTDEMEHLLGTDDLKGYQPFTTPVFQPGRARYQATTQREMMAFIDEYANASAYMHVYSMGTTSNYGYDYPLIVFTKKEIPAGATMAQAAQILREGKLPIVWQQAQIHPYEPAAGESALVMIQELCGAYGEDILDKIDVVMVPRVNVEGAFLYWRLDYNAVDMNRDHMVVSTEQNLLMHKAYYLFMPHVVVDNHEFFFSEMGNYEKDAERFLLNDFQITGASSLNNDPAVTRLSTEVLVDKMHRDLKETGFRPYHYGITSNNPIGRAYYGLGNAVSILIESHGADGALFAMPRRVYGQVVATKSVFEGAAAHAQELVQTVNAARDRVVELGRTYDENDILVLKQSASGAVTSPTALDLYVADIHGNIQSLEAKKINLQDTVDRSRTRPTAYLVDADAPFVDGLLRILSGHGAEHLRLKAGTELELQQYRFVEPDGTKSCIAELTEPAPHTFEQGAILIPMDQVAGNVLGMLMEPDVGDSGRYNGTLYQFGLLKHDEETKLMPLYRFIGDNPREALAAFIEP